MNEKTIVDKRGKYTQAVKNLFSIENPDARVVIGTLIKRCNVLTPTFVAGSPEQTAFNEGQRHVVCSLLSHIHKDPYQLIRQLQAIEDETTA